MATARRRSNDVEVDVYVNVNVNDDDASFASWMETSRPEGHRSRANAGTIDGSQKPLTSGTRRMLIPEGTTPIKTAEGLDELARRTRRLSQRHRTVLLLVDGRRSTEQIVALAMAAGVQRAVFDDLTRLGLIGFHPAHAAANIASNGSPGVSALAHTGGAGVPAAASSVRAAIVDVGLASATPPSPMPVGPSAARDSDGKMPGSLEADQPLKGGEPLVPAASAAADPYLAATAARETAAAAAEHDDRLVVVPAEPTEPTEPTEPSKPSQGSSGESLLPPVQSLLPDSAWSELSERARRGPSGVDRPLEEARDILLRAVRAEAPIAGRLLLLKIKRAGSRVELDALLDEVEPRISKPRRMIAAAQTLRHVRHLLGMPADTATMYGTGP